MLFEKLPIVLLKNYIFFLSDFRVHYLLSTYIVVHSQCATDTVSVSVSADISVSVSLSVSADTDFYIGR